MIFIIPILPITPITRITRITRTTAWTPFRLTLLSDRLAATGLPIRSTRLQASFRSCSMWLGPVALGTISLTRLRQPAKVLRHSLELESLSQKPSSSKVGRPWQQAQSQSVALCSRNRRAVGAQKRVSTARRPNCKSSQRQRSVRPPSECQCA